MLSRLRENSDDGVTLIELVVGMTLMTIVGAIALNFFVGTTAQANRVTEQSLVGNTARAAMTQLAKTLQLADTPNANAGYAAGRFVTITANELTFYSNVSATGRSGTSIRTAPTKVDFTLTNGTLWESMYLPQGTTAPATYPSNPTSRNALVTGVVNTPAQPLFTYCSDATDPSTTCTATSDLTAVSLVQATIVVQGLKGTASQTVQSGIAVAGQVS